MITIKLDGTNDPTEPYKKNNYYWPSLYCKIKVIDEHHFNIEEMPEFLSNITDEVNNSPMDSDECVYGGHELFPGRWDMNTPTEPGEYIYVMELDDLIEWRNRLNNAISILEVRSER